MAQCVIKHTGSFTFTVYLQIYALCKYSLVTICVVILTLLSVSVSYVSPPSIVEPHETVFASQRLGKHVPAVTNTPTTTEELLDSVFYVRSARIRYSICSERNYFYYLHPVAWIQLIILIWQIQPSTQQMFINLNHTACFDPWRVNFRCS
jgi:hypothetical protein